MPSKVLHVRNVTDDVSPDKVVEAINHIVETNHPEHPQDTVRYIVLVPKHQQALVEMATVEHATAVIDYAKRQSIFIGKKHVMFQYSRSQECNRTPPSLTQAEGEVHRGEKCVMITVYNPMFPIYVKDLYEVLSRYGTVQRIVIFTKNGIQALVEFATPEEANNVKVNLDSRDLFNNCCTLRIQFSQTATLNVKYNSNRTYDYTNPNLPSGPIPSPPPTPPSLPSQYYSTTASPYLGIPGLNSPPYTPSTPPSPITPGSSYNNYSMPFPPYGPVVSPRPRMMTTYAPMVTSSSPTFSGPAMVPHMTTMQTPMPVGLAHHQMMSSDPARSVLILYNVDERLTCDTLFNVFCIYGNVIKVKILAKKRPGTALVQMGNPVFADLAMTSLNGVQIFGKHIQVSYSKHPHIADSRPYSDAAQRELQLDDENPTRDYSASQLNRFIRHNSNLKHIYKPSTVLYFSNAAPSITEETMKQVFASEGSPIPTKVKFFELRRSESVRGHDKKVGLLEFEDVPTATDAVAICNNKFIEHCTLKLSFSSNVIHY